MEARRIAVLVDGDNISASHANEILSRAGNLGRIDVARVYAGMHPSCDWLNTPGYRLMHAGAGKNAADVLLCIDAMELTLTGELSAFVIATSDGDFAHLAHRQRERGLHVLGLGEDKAPKSFRLACSEFQHLESAVAEERLEAKQDDYAFDRKIRSIIKKNSQKSAGMQIAQLSLEMKQAYGTKISSSIEGNWRGYLSKRPNLYDLDPRGPNAMVRYKPDGFAALPL
ncbi:NYN domain-containing protein [Roseovarius sp. S4756]|uniref:NYN domain-containing protein n=1 Tax=Roseovarius maritimus TaxID=3342637 RepID=UPI00372844EF